MPIVTRIAGNCPVCQGLFKLTADHKMVHHGYLRPGIGQIIRDCFGVGWPPYQLSSSGCKAYEEFSLRRIEETKEYIGRLERSEPEVLYSDSRYNPQKYERGTEMYDRVRRRQIDAAGSQIVQMQYGVKMMRQYIAEWAPAPLIEIDEEGLTPQLKKERDERRERKEADRAERERERAAKRAKTAQREADKLAQHNEFIRQIAVLASWPQSGNRTLQAYRLNAAMMRFYKGGTPAWGLPGISGMPDDKRREIERQMVEIGLGRYEDSNGRRWFSHYRNAVSRGKPEID